MIFGDPLAEISGKYLAKGFYQKIRGAERYCRPIARTEMIMWFPFDKDPSHTKIN